MEHFQLNKHVCLVHKSLLFCNDAAQIGRVYIDN